MKKYLSFFSIGLIIALAMAPRDASAQLSMSPKLDSIVNTDTAIFELSSPVPNFSFATFEVNMTKVSGTVAGSAQLQGSISGNTWYTITDANEQGSVTLSNADNNIAWQLYGRGFVKYRVRVIGSGTSKSYVKAAAYFQRE